MPASTQICISTIQRMYSILKGEDLDESAEETPSSEYSREQAIIDGVNVGEDIFLIEAEVGQRGGYIVKQQIEYRNRLSREKRWKQVDEDISYVPSRLDRDMVNPSQIRTVIRAFKENLYTTLFPRREEVPKTLIEDGKPITEQQGLLDTAQRELVTAAAAPFHRPEVRDYIENVRRSAGAGGADRGGTAHFRIINQTQYFDS